MWKVFAVVLTTICLTIFGAYAGDIDNCLKCICKVESNCKALGCHNDGGSLSCGFFQIKENYYIDCGQPGKKSGESTDIGWKRCAGDYECSKKCVKAYMNRYGSRCRANPNCEIYARIHNGGPMGCRSGSTIAYWNKVKRCLD